jgi:hypothetical protein
MSWALARSGFLRAEAGQALPPFPAPLARQRCSCATDKFLLAKPNSLHNRDASVAYIPMLFGIIPECLSESSRNQRSPSPESPISLDAWMG